MYHLRTATYSVQFEIVTGPLPPLEACDALIATREIIMNCAAKYGMRATLAPRLYNNNCSYSVVSGAKYLKQLTRLKISFRWKRSTHTHLFKI